MHSTGQDLLINLCPFGEKFYVLSNKHFIYRITGSSILNNKLIPRELMTISRYNKFILEN